jgi:transketolase
MSLVNLKKRILEIAFKYKIGHLGSYLSAVEIIDEIYKTKAADDIFILSSGHAALALYVVLEKYEHRNAEELFVKHGGHPKRCENDGVYCSTGSLGLGITVAVGRALANKHRKVHVLISDGEAAEGSVWEALRYIEEGNVKNIEVYANINGYSAYDKVDIPYLVKRLQAFLPKIHLRYTTVNHYPFLKGLNAHYHIMSEDDYKSIL